MFFWYHCVFWSRSQHGSAMYSKIKNISEQDKSSAKSKVVLFLQSLGGQERGGEDGFESGSGVLDDHVIVSGVGGNGDNVTVTDLSTIVLSQDANSLKDEIVES